MLGSALQARAQVTIHVPTDQPTIQAAINAANNGDTVLVAPGTYYESIDFLGKAITVESSAGPATTIIDAFNKAAFVVTFQSNETRGSILKGFTVENGGIPPTNFETPLNADPGPFAAPLQDVGGIRVLNGASPVIVGNTITGNVCNGIYSQSSAPLIQNNEVTNTSTQPGYPYEPYPCVVYFFVGWHDVPAAPVLLEWGETDPPPAIPAVVSGNTIENNFASNLGGGISVLRATQAVINPPYDGTIDTPFFIIENNIVRNNNVGLNNGIVGGTWTPAPGGDASVFLYMEEPTPGIVAQNLIYGNAGCVGGGIEYFAHVPPDFVATIPSNYLYGPVIDFFINNLVADNSIIPNGTPCAWQPWPITNSGPVEPAGSQITLFGAPRAEFANNIVVGNSTDPALAFLDDSLAVCFQFCAINPIPVADLFYEIPVFDHNDIFNPDGPSFSEGGIALNPVGTYGNISTDPLFVDAASSNYHLLADSPAIDAGNTSALQQIADLAPDWALTTDLDGNPRVQDATGKGYPIVDMGPYEYAGAQEAGATTIVLTPSSYAPVTGTLLTLTAQLISPNGTPTGSVTFYANSAPIGTAPIDGSGSATISTQSIKPGLVPLLATYPGRGDFAPAVSVEVLILVQPAIEVAVTANINPQELGRPVTFTATVSAGLATAAPVGTVTFFDGANSLGTVTLNAAGTATVTTSTLTIGQHSITASFLSTAAGSAPIVSPVYTETIVAYLGNFTIAVAPTAQTVYTGEPTQSITVTLTPSGGFDRDVTLSCGQLPANTTCTFTQTTIPGASGVSQLVIQSTAPHQVTSTTSAHNSTWPRKTGLALAALALIFLPFRIPFRRRSSRLLRMLSAFLLVALLAGITGCGAPSDTGGTPPGVYNISINATFSGYGATLTHSAQFSLTVKSLF